MTSQRRRPLVAGNWKMHRTGPEAVELIRPAPRRAAARARAEVMVAPPFTALEAAARALEGSGIALGAQNVHWEAQGAFTGEISAGMLKAVGCTYVIVGHSERRQLFGETDASVSKKTRAVLHAGMRPVVCIGETLAERDAGRTLEVVRHAAPREPRRGGGRGDGARGAGLRAGVGHRHRAERDAGAGAGGPRPHPRGAGPAVRPAGRRRRCGSSTAAR